MVTFIDSNSLVKLSILSSIFLIILISYFIFFKDFIYFWREGEGGRKRKKNINVQETHWLVASCMPQTGDLAQANQWHFGSQSGAQSTEPHQPRLISYFKVPADNTNVWITCRSWGGHGGRAHFSLSLFLRIQKSPQNTKSHQILLVGSALSPWSKFKVSFSLGQSFSHLFF